MSFAPRLGRVVRLNKVKTVLGHAGASANTQRTYRTCKSRLPSPSMIGNSLSTGLRWKTQKSFMVNRHNIFQTILRSSVPPQEKTAKRLGQEGFVAIAAGGEICGRMMTDALYHTLANKDQVMPILAKELAEVMPTPDI